MRLESKNLSLFLIVVLAVFTLTMAKPAHAQSIPKPSIPELTLRYVNNSYYMPPTYGMDPYSGKNIQIGGGFTIQNKSIELTIRNQPFTSYRDGPYINSNNISLYYRVGYKGHFEDQWHYYTSYAQTSSEYTIILAGLVWDGSQPPINLGNLPNGSQVDFQVQAQIGYFTPNEQYPFFPLQYGDFHGQSSDWSNTQTLTIGASAPIATPSTSQSQTTPATIQPSVPFYSQEVILFGLDWVQIAMMTLLITIAVLLSVVVVFLRKRSVKPSA